jgi:hypothetical protein
MVGGSLDRLNLHVEWLGYSLDANEAKGAGMTDIEQEVDQLIVEMIQYD